MVLYSLLAISNFDLSSRRNRDYLISNFHLRFPSRCWSSKSFSNQKSRPQSCFFMECHQQSIPSPMWIEADQYSRVRTLTGKEIELDIESDYKVKGHRKLVNLTHDLLSFPGITNKRESRREGGYSTCAAASDIRGKANVRLLVTHLPRPGQAYPAIASNTDINLGSGSTIKLPRTIPLKAVQLYILSSPFGAVFSKRPTQLMRQGARCSRI